VGGAFFCPAGTPEPELILDEEREKTAPRIESGDDEEIAILGPLKNLSDPPKDGIWSVRFLKKIFGSEFQKLGLRIRI
jgi:hypothetical protein